MSYPPAGCRRRAGTPVTPPPDARRNGGGTLPPMRWGGGGRIHIPPRGPTPPCSRSSRHRTGQSRTRTSRVAPYSPPARYPAGFVGLGGRVEVPSAVRAAAPAPGPLAQARLYHPRHHQRQQEPAAQRKRGRLLVLARLRLRHQVRDGEVQHASRARREQRTQAARGSPCRKYQPHRAATNTAARMSPVQPRMRRACPSDHPPRGSARRCSAPPRCCRRRSPTRSAAPASGSTAAPTPMLSSSMISSALVPPASTVTSSPRGGWRRWKRRTCDRCSDASPATRPRWTHRSNP